MIDPAPMGPDIACAIVSIEVEGDAAVITLRSTGWLLEFLRVEDHIMRELVSSCGVESYQQIRWAVTEGGE